MKYLCLICPEKTFDQMPQAEAQRMMQDYTDLAEELRGSGRMIGGNRLQRADTAATVRVRSGTISVTDGPWAETKEVLGGYFLIEAKDLNEAIQVAARIPAASMGCVEVRPVAEP